ncbi:hypothetical protein [Paenibacillus sp. Leaf72]|uniref:hypothetical protein n=1 Tax=Paenibacillus sp. Leaf72 TaxID=1736234 RepID=UPI000AB95643|nr:hypothetical protein [Paenibacillus sp. Leaf72]
MSKMSKKKLGSLSLLLVLVAVLVAACGGSTKDVDLGTTAKGTYSNEYFGVSLNFPEEWEYQDSETMNQLTSEVGEAIVGNDDKKKKQLDYAQTKTLNLLMASQYPIGGEQTGASVMAIAEKLSMLQGIKTGKDYLEASKKFMVESQLPYEYKDIVSTKVGGKDFDMMEVTINAGEVTVTQHYYSAILEGYAFNLITTYLDDETKKTTDDVISSVTFK